MAIGVLGLALYGAVMVSGAAAAKTEVRPVEEEVMLYVGAPGHANRNVLGLTVHARQGAAVLFTESSDVETENDRGVVYATRTRVGPLDGHLDVRFPGLGRIVGRLSGNGKPEPGRHQGCEGPSEVSESGHFVGTLVFHGSGGYGTWRASHAVARIVRHPRLRCKAGDAPTRPPPPKTLFGYLGEYGPGFAGGSNGPWSILSASIPGQHSSTEFTAEVDGRGSGETVGFTALSYEELAGGVVCERWADRRRIPRRVQFEIGPGGRRPPSATVRPPGPFSGEATYSRKGHTFLGDLTVHLLGRTVRLAGAGAEALVVNSD